MRNAIYLALVLIGPCFVQAQEQQTEKPSRLVDIYNQFMDRFSDGNPAWKTEIVLRADVGKPPRPPYKLHYDDSLGYYSYRVKRWDELDEYEKFALQNDPRLPHFIREEAFNIRNTNSHPSGQMTAAGAGRSEISAGTGGAQASAGETNAPIAAPIRVSMQQRGILTREGAYGLAYKFDPDELINPHPLRLMEAPEH